jgi:peptidoglycan/LPS O-acetylase OafA/YrhL
VLCHSGYFGQKTWRQFVTNRIARLYPLHLVTALVVLAMHPWLPRGGDQPMILLEQATLTHSLGIPPTIVSLNVASWSISVEIWLALLFFVILPRRTVWPLLVLAVLAAAMHPPGDGHVERVWITSAGVWRGLAGFSLGALAYQLHELPRRRRFRPWEAHAIAGLLLACMLVGPGAWWRTALFHTLSFAALVALADTPHTLFSRRVPQWLGDISYSVYLWHVPVYYLSMLVLGAAIKGSAAKLVMVAAVLVIAHFSRRWLELPAQGALRRWLGSALAPAPMESRAVADHVVPQRADE